jgi:hypothetical protein
MARAQNKKCQQCAKLSVGQAKTLHGPSGDGCWEGQRCHDRRSRYRNRDSVNVKRKEKRLTENGVTTLDLPPPEACYAVAFFYRSRIDQPLHAIGAELWSGNRQIAMLSPVHCLGIPPEGIRKWLIQILKAFSNFTKEPVKKFRSAVELHPQTCPIRPCPLHTTPFSPRDECTILHIPPGGLST